MICGHVISMCHRFTCLKRGFASAVSKLSSLVLHCKTTTTHKGSELSKLFTTFKYPCCGVHEPNEENSHIKSIGSCPAS